MLETGDGGAGVGGWRLEFRVIISFSKR